MIDKMVKNELNQKVWSFSEIANVSETVSESGSPLLLKERKKE